MRASLQPAIRCIHGSWGFSGYGVTHPAGVAPALRAVKLLPAESFPLRNSPHSASASSASVAVKQHEFIAPDPRRPACMLHAACCMLPAACRAAVLVDRLIGVADDYPETRRDETRLPVRNQGRTCRPATANQPAPSPLSCPR
ncbi:hypothetical protein E4U53_004487 [Claviceps sorghi]|nr:hypothetical protein E4U53_004487 [Claviceps sorghi]